MGGGRLEKCTHLACPVLLIRDTVAHGGIFLEGVGETIRTFTMCSVRIWQDAFVYEGFRLWYKRIRVRLILIQRFLDKPLRYTPENKAAFEANFA